MRALQCFDRLSTNGKGISPFVTNDAIAFGFFSSGPLVEKPFTIQLPKRPHSRTSNHRCVVTKKRYNRRDK